MAPTHEIDSLIEEDKESTLQHAEAQTHTQIPSLEEKEYYLRKVGIMIRTTSMTTTSTVFAAAAFAGGTALGYYLSSRIRTSKQPTEAKDELNPESHLWKIVQYSMTAALISAGDKLDLYNKLYQWGPNISAKEIVQKTGWNERWLKEFLLQSCAAGICIYTEEEDGGSEGKFTIKEGYAKLLRGPDEERKSLAGMFPFLSGMVRRSDQVVQAIETGYGVDYDYGTDEVDICEAIDRKNRNFFQYHLIDDIIAPLTIPQTGKSLLEALEVGGMNVADVGCGCGASTIVLAKRFSKSHFYAYESSPRSLQLIQEGIIKAGLSNITICDVKERTVGDGPDLKNPNSKFDFIYSHDVLHDMTNPRELIKDVKSRLCPNSGCWYIVDVDCTESITENLKRSNAATLYGFSCLLCLAMATSSPGAEGLGTCGFTPSLAAKWMKQAGFTYFEKQRTLKSVPNNACYLVA